MQLYPESQYQRILLGKINNDIDLTILSDLAALYDTSFSKGKIKIEIFLTQIFARYPFTFIFM